MYDNRNWLWQYQDKPIMSTLYDGMFTIVSKVSSEPMNNVLDVDNAESACLRLIAKIRNIPEAGSVMADAMVWTIDDWNDAYWNGTQSSLDEDFFRRFIKMKTYIYGMPFCLETINTAINFLGAGHFYCVVTESAYHCDIEIMVDNQELADLINGALAADPLWFGKPSGVSYTITTNVLTREDLGLVTVTAGTTEDMGLVTDEVTSTKDLGGLF